MPRVTVSLPACTSPSVVSGFSDCQLCTSSSGCVAVALAPVCLPVSLLRAGVDIPVILIAIPSPAAPDYRQLRQRGCGCGGSVCAVVLSCGACACACPGSCGLAKCTSIYRQPVFCSCTPLASSPVPADTGRLPQAPTDTSAYTFRMLVPTRAHTTMRATSVVRLACGRPPRFPFLAPLLARDSG